MAAAAINGDGKAGCADRDEFTDHSVIGRMVEMRSQDYGLRGIAAALAKQGVATYCLKASNISLKVIK
jgi:hypothetical protein